MQRHPRYSYLNLEPFDAQPKIPDLPQYAPPQPPELPQPAELYLPPGIPPVRENNKVPPVDSPEFLTNLDALVSELGIPVGESSPDSEEVPHHEPSPRRRRRSSNLNLKSASQIDLDEDEENLTPFDRHVRKCKICKSPKCDEIEQAFLEWQSPDVIRRDFRIRDRHTIYRHARARGLLEIRGRNLRAALAHILEQSCFCRPTGESVIRAARAYASLTGYVNWVEPPTTHIVVPARPTPALPALAGRTLFARPVKHSKRLRTKISKSRPKRGHSRRKV